MIKAKLFQELKGFDEDLFMHQEEIDLCWRIQGLGKKIGYCPKSEVYHYGGGTLKKGNWKLTLFHTELLSLDLDLVI